MSCLEHEWKSKHKIMILCGIASIYFQWSFSSWLFVTFHDHSTHIKHLLTHSLEFHFYIISVAFVYIWILKHFSTAPTAYVIDHPLCANSTCWRAFLCVSYIVFVEKYVCLQHSRGKSVKINSTLPSNAS